MRRVNILADKSLLAAFVEDTHDIEARHVQAAMRDSELSSARKLPDKKLLLGSAAAALLLFSLAAWWMLGQKTGNITSDLADVSGQPSRMASSSIRGQRTDVSASLAPPLTRGSREGLGRLGGVNNEPKPVLSRASTAGNVAVTTPPPVPVAGSTPTTKKPSLFEQRLAAGKQLLEQKKAVASIQLFYNEEVKPERIEGFLKRANALGKLPEIYLLPAKFGGKNGLRVLYGAYPSIDAAHNAVKDLPARYQEAFATSTYIF
jgi:septal ring-binding cell division protein DamX